MTAQAEPSICHSSGTSGVLRTTMPARMILARRLKRSLPLLVPVLRIRLKAVLVRNPPRSLLSWTQRWITTDTTPCSARVLKQIQGNAWFRPNEDNVAVGVALRVDSNEYRVLPFENLGLEPFEAAVRVLTPAGAVKVRSAAVHAALAEV